MGTRIRFAMCGCGRVGSRWLEVFAQNSETELIGIADPDPEAFKKLKDFHLERVPTYSTLEQLYLTSIPDVTVILTPPQYHARYIQEAIDVNSHVLVEKPVCVDLEQLQFLNRANKIAKKKNLHFVVNQQYRWNPRIQAIKDAIDQDLIGDIFLIQSKFNQNEYQFNSWWRQQLKYISLLNWYVHHIDTMRYYLGQRPISVQATFLRPSHSQIQGYSSMVLNVQFEKAFWSFCANQEGKYAYVDSGHTSFVMYGSKGTLVNTKNKAPQIFTEQWLKGKDLGENIAIVDNEAKYPPGWGETVNKMITSLRTGAQHPTNFEDNLWTMGIVLGAIKSNEEQKTIYIADLLKAIK